MRILALDLGTKTGWAFGETRPIAIGDTVPVDHVAANPTTAVTLGATVSGCASFKPGRYEGGGMRFVRFVGWLHDLYDALRFDHVWFEEVRRHAGTDAAHVYGGLMAQLQEFCEGKGIPYAGVPVGTIKKFATGSGNASKDLVIEAVKRYGWDPKDDNEADAIALLLWAVWGQ